MTLVDLFPRIFRRAAHWRDGPIPVPFNARRPRARRPTIEALEARLPLGDAVLGSVAAWWLGASLAPLESAVRASDDTLAFESRTTNLRAGSSDVEAKIIFCRAPLS